MLASRSVTLDMYLHDFRSALDDEIAAAQEEVAILRYEPEYEWEVRQEARRPATHMADVGKEVHTISLADLLWEVIDDSAGIDALARLEQRTALKRRRRK